LGNRDTKLTDTIGALVFIFGLVVMVLSPTPFILTGNWLASLRMIAGGAMLAVIGVIFFHFFRRIL